MAQIILDSNNNLIQGDFDNATLNNRTKLQTTTTNATSNVYVVPNGSATSAGVSVANNSSLTNASKIVMATNGSTDTQIISGVNGSGTYLPLNFYTNNALSMTIDTANNVGIGTSSPTTGKLVISQSNLVQPAISLPIDESTIQGPSTNTKINMGGNLFLAGNNIATVASYGASGYINFLSNGANERMRIGSSGNLFYNCTSEPSSSVKGWGLFLTGSGGSTGQYVSSATTNSGNFDHYYFYSVNGLAGFIRTNGTTCTYNSVSDVRLKENIVPMTGALDKVLQLKPVTYTWKSDGSEGQGFIAHELAEIIPDCVAGEKDAVNEDGSIKPQGVDTSFLVATLTAAIQEQQTIINELKTRIEALESK